MIKKLYLILICIGSLGIMACGQNQTKEIKTKKQDSAVENQDSQGAVDCDLTNMSNTMVIAEITNITNQPDLYVGKTLRMEGVHLWEEKEDGKQHYVLVTDDTFCCQIGLEFVVEGGEKDELYPPYESNVKVEGELKTYDLQGETRYYIDTTKVNVEE